MADEETIRKEPGGGREARVALTGWSLAADSIVDGLAEGPIEVVGRCQDPYSADDALLGVKADIVIIELPSLQDSDLELLHAIRAACRAESSIVLYRFARSAVLRRLRLAGHTPVRAVPDATAILAVCHRTLHPAQSLRVRAGATSSDEEHAPPPKFDQQTLAGLAAASRTVDCECPKHLVDLVMDLGSFERYSAQCAARGPADRALHRELERAAGRARAIIETALEQVAVAEGFALPATIVDV